MNTADIFEEASSVYRAVEGAADLVLEGLQRVRNELDGEAVLAEETGAVLKEAAESFENLRRLRKTVEKLAELTHSSERRIEHLLSEDRVIYPEPEFGISTFEKLAPHEALMPFEKREIETTVKLDEEVLF